MIGNLILGITKFFKQHFLCVHQYQWIYRKDNGDSFEECEKCNLLKDEGDGSATFFITVFCIVIIYLIYLYK